MRAASRAVLAALAFAGLASSAHAALFDDDEARARVEALRRQMAATQQSVDERLAKIEGELRDRSALVDLAGQIEALRGDLSRMREQIEVLLNQAETADKRQKDLYLDIDTRLRKIEQPKEASAADKPADAAASPEET